MSCLIYRRILPPFEVWSSLRGLRTLSVRNGAEVKELSILASLANKISNLAQAFDDKRSKIFLAELMLIWTIIDQFLFFYFNVFFSTSE